MFYTSMVDFITPVVLHTQFPWPLGASRPTGFRLAPFQRSSSPAAVDSNPRAGLYIQQAALCAWRSAAKLKCLFALTVASSGLQLEVVPAQGTTSHRNMIEDS